MSEPRVAKPGDLCVLLIPEDEERLALRQEQEALARLYHGWIVPEPHITCQRFRLEPGRLLGDVMKRVQAAADNIAPFTIQAAGITQFLAPFWGTYVLRWQVLEDETWRGFVKTLDDALLAVGCQLHYAHDMAPTCSAVDLTRQVKLDAEPGVAFPHPLFVMRKMIFTGILGSNDFETLGEVRLNGGRTG